MASMKYLFTYSKLCAAMNLITFIVFQDSRFKGPTGFWILNILDNNRIGEGGACNEPS